MHDRNDDDLVAIRMDFINCNIRQPRHGLFERPLIAPGVPHMRKPGEIFRALEHALDHRFGGGRAVFGDPIVNTFEIDESFFVED